MASFSVNLSYLIFPLVLLSVVEWGFYGPNIISVTQRALTTSSGPGLILFNTLPSPLPVYNRA